MYRSSAARTHRGAARRTGLLLGALLLAACSPLPSLDGRPDSRAFTDTDGTFLGRLIAPRARAHPGRSGILPLVDGHSAFAARMRLADAAERSLDVQYYIWHDDLSGTLLFDALRRAADRGVRVRLLLDDNRTAGMDRTLAALDAHPHIEVRLFNPFTIRRFRPLAYLLDFARLNRRMHNKSFTADNQATIIGGRNVGDEYFDATDAGLFADLDVLAVGPVVQEVSRDFDRYWSSGSAYPADRILAPIDSAAAAEAAQRARERMREPRAQDYLISVAAHPFVQDLLARRLTFHWAPTRMISDDPAKGLGLAESDAMLPHRLAERLGVPQRRLRLVSPYFVPADAGTRELIALAEGGVDVRILTNSLAASDVLPVHAGYAKRRKALLRAGVRLFELRHTDDPPAPRPGIGISSASSLHAKTFAVDGERVFIGSFNFDPRSARLNTEMGFVIEDPELTRTIFRAFAEIIPRRAYEVRLTGTGELEWLERDGDEVVVHRQEPDTTLWQRALVRLIALLPVEWLL
ncbi:MAG TPA: phospholipase D family protein [Pseudomonadales bacterium]